MRGVSRGRIIGAIITTVTLTALVASFIVFVLRPGAAHTAHASSTALAGATATVTSGATAQFTPAPGVTVTVQATPTKGTGSSSSTSTTAYTGGAGGTTSVTPPRYPTPIPTSSAGSGSGGGATPTPTTAPAATPPAATPTPALKDDATVVTYSPTSLDVNDGVNGVSGYVAVNVTMLNTGSTTWDTFAGYTIKCLQYCGQSWNVPNLALSAAPGQSFTFPGELFISPINPPYTVTQSVWQMFSLHSGFFGPQVVIPVVIHGYYSALQETSPTCENDGAVWTRVNTAGTVTCQPGDVALAGGGPGSVSMALTSIPSGYSYTHYMAKVHVHFTTTSSATFAGIILTLPTSSNYHEEQVYMVSPAGYFCETNLITICVTTGSTWSLRASSDYDITVGVSSALQFGAITSNGGSLEGGFSGGGATGLVELTASGSTDAAYFSNYQLYQFK